MVNSSSTKWFSTAQETKIADTLGWRVVAGSGAMPCNPGDVESDDWLGECKTHMSNSNSIYFNHDVWEKIKEESMSKRKRPVLITDDGSRDLTKTWCVCLSHSFDLAGINVLPYTKVTRKNLSFYHHDLYEAIRKYRRTIADADRIKPCAYSYKWLDDDILIMLLDDFKTCCED